VKEVIYVITKKVILIMATSIVVLLPEGNSGVSGSLLLKQGSEDGPTTIEGQLRGLTPDQKHGLSICTYGDVRDGATSCGPIFNPFGECFHLYILSRKRCYTWCIFFSFCFPVLMISLPPSNLVAGKTHGAPTDDASLRMVGDIGNIQANELGVATVHLSDEMVKLFGPHSVIGRSMVVYAGEDDQGRGGQESSLTTGNAGPRIAYGVIGLANPQQ
jgi:superoxide dismutase, Cu-Zn family